MWDGHLESQKNPDRLKRSIHVDRIGVHSTFVYIYAVLRVLMIWADCFFHLTCLFFLEKFFTSNNKSNLHIKRKLRRLSVNSPTEIHFEFFFRLHSRLRDSETGFQSCHYPITDTVDPTSTNTELLARSQRFLDSCDYSSLKSSFPTPVIGEHIIFASQSVTDSGNFRSENSRYQSRFDDFGFFSGFPKLQ